MQSSLEKLVLIEVMKLAVEFYALRIILLAQLDICKSLKR